MSHFHHDSRPLLSVVQGRARAGRPGPQVQGLALALGAIAMLLAVACGEEPVPEKPMVRPVKILEVGAGGAGELREFPGELSAAQTADAGFEVSGKVIELPVDEGQQVEAGAVLARLDPRDFEAELDAVRARDKAALAEFERTRLLFQEDVTSKQQLEVAQRNYEVTKAKVAIARKALEDAVLRAPFAGVVARKLVDDFANVQAKQPVLILQDTSHLEIVINIPEADFAAADPGLSPADRTALVQPRVIVGTIADREFPARIKEAARTADSTTRTYAVTLAFDNPPDVNLLPGMTAKVRVRSAAAAASGALWIPANAARTDESGKAFVWVVDPDSMTVQRRPVRLGQLSGSQVEVGEGLQPGELIATSGVHHLREGMQVRQFEK